MEASFATEEYQLTMAQRRELDEEKLRIARRQTELKMLQAGEKQQAEEARLRAEQKAKKASHERRRKAAARQGECKSLLYFGHFTDCERQHQRVVLFPFICLNYSHNLSSPTCCSPQPVQAASLC